MGLRTIREMILKHEFILNEFNLNYLAGYTKFRNKNVNNAAKAIINHFRATNPKLLERKYRGK